MKPSLPWTLIVVAVIFLVSGVSTTIQVLELLVQGRYDINFTLLSTVIGVGLLWRQRWSRVLALIYSAFYIVEGAVLAVVCLATPQFLWGPLGSIALGI